MLRNSTISCHDATFLEFDSFVYVSQPISRISKLLGVIKSFLLFFSHCQSFVARWCGSFVLAFNVLIWKKIDYFRKNLKIRTSCTTGHSKEFFLSFDIVNIWLTRWVMKRTESCSSVARVTPTKISSKLTFRIMEKSSPSKSSTTERPIGTSNGIQSSFALINFS